MDAELIETFRTALMDVCLWALALLGVAMVVVKLLVPFWREIRRAANLPRIELVFVAAFTLCFVKYGATKAVYFRDGIKNNPDNKSVVTNNTISIRWVRDTSGGILVPESAPVYIDYRLSTDTNGQWESFAETTVGAWQYNAIMQDATNWDFTVWAYYIPPEPVHTNGVWIYKTMKDRADRYALPLRARTEINGKAIATPAEVRKDSEK